MNARSHALPIGTYAIGQVLENVSRTETHQICIAFRTGMCLDRIVATRPANPMPADVEQRLVGEGLMDNYKERPRYQRNDYLGWIARAKQPATQQKRIQQMLDELRAGGVYMNMEHAPSKKA